MKETPACIPAGSILNRLIFWWHYKQTSFPSFAGVATCRCLGNGTDGGLPVSGLIRHPSYHIALASPPFLSALPALRLHGKGGQCQREKALQVHGAGWGGGGGRDVAQASHHFIPCTRGFQKRLCCARLNQLKVCMEPAQMSSPYC